MRAGPSELTSELSNDALHAQEVGRGDRFEFGRNWQAFLRVVDEPRIRAAEASLQRMLRVTTLEGQRFLDIGSGSGLFSLAARRLGAQVHSFDFDPQSVACGRELRRRHATGDPEWTIEQGSALDRDYLDSLGTFDIVYSWGVLHHTGRMWEAIDNATRPVRPGGKFFIAIYNDLGTRTARWHSIKRLYNRLPRIGQPVLTVATMLPGEVKAIGRALLKGRPGDYVREWTTYNDRGMNRWRDMIDWVGGYPYEVATPEEIFEFCRARGFSLAGLKCGGVGLGCNEFVFVRGTTEG
ncbi:MAG: class I SAM-dependent methyltransferase [Acidobacteria bacterium]|nr:class I SAM-dependent methyltransferase [Acidobacteriota bacterium]MBA3884345.1 class I SAM-dependent methyltransferase [Acidobacteriota bacterium]